MRHFDSHAYRTEDQQGVWDFAAGSMRTYLILKEKVAQFYADPDIQALLSELSERGSKAGARFKFSKELATSIKDESFDLPAMRDRGYGYERLDQLTMEIIFGVR
jgi:xylose isomerase